MCLAVPGRIVAVEDGRAKVDFSGIVREVRLDLLPQAGVGNYVLVHAGFAIQMMESSEAVEIIGLLREAEEG